MREWRTSPCRSCEEAMIWCLTSKGKKMPLDVEEVSRAEAGPRALLFEIQEAEPGASDKTPRAVVLMVTAESGHRAHWASCEKREQFRK